MNTYLTWHLKESGACLVCVSNFEIWQIFESDKYNNDMATTTFWIVPDFLLYSDCQLTRESPSLSLLLRARLLQPIVWIHSYTVSSVKQDFQQKDAAVTDYFPSQTEKCVFHYEVLYFVFYQCLKKIKKTVTLLLLYDMLGGENCQHSVMRVYRGTWTSD